MKQPYAARTLPEAQQMVALAEAHKKFKVRRLEGLTALNYVYLTGEPDQFTHPFSEFRGLIIDESTNEVVARPFQKFWHAGEKAAEPTDWNEPHVILPKLDGSLVYPARNRLVTKGGVTGTSLRAEALAQEIGRPIQALLDRLRIDPDDGAACTPLFEYIGRENTIVIPYRVTQLVLLAVRRIGDGRYWSHEQMSREFAITDSETGTGAHLDIVRPVTGIQSQQQCGNRDYNRRLVEEIAGWPATREGIVVAFGASGHRLKIKSREYVALHRARDDYSMETRVLRCWVDGNADKLLANLSDDRAEHLRAYYREIESRMEQTARETATAATQIFEDAEGDRKTAAVAWIAATRDRKAVKHLGFTAFDAVARKSDAAEAVKDEIRRNIARKCNRQTKVDTEIRPMLGDNPPVWAPADGNQHDIDA